VNKMRKILSDTADYFALPADLIAGIPKLEVIGTQEFSIEPHNGLIEYATEQIQIETAIGSVVLGGKNLTIKLMNRKRITVYGNLYMVKLQEP